MSLYITLEGLILVYLTSPCTKCLVTIQQYHKTLIRRYWGTIPCITHCRTSRCGIWLPILVYLGFEQLYVLYTIYFLISVFLCICISNIILLMIDRTPQIISNYMVCNFFFTQFWEVSNVILLKRVFIKSFEIEVI